MILILILTNIIAIFFIIKKTAGKLSPRIEALLILASFLATSISVHYIDAQIGYSPISSIPYLVFSAPLVIYLLSQYKNIRETSLIFSRYLIGYFIVNAIVLPFYAFDVGRHFLGG